jgi:hypothetical protein
MKWLCWRIWRKLKSRWLKHQPAVWREKRLCSQQYGQPIRLKANVSENGEKLGVISAGISEYNENVQWR